MYVLRPGLSTGQATFVLDGPEFRSQKFKKLKKVLKKVGIPEVLLVWYNNKNAPREGPT
ncbi:hypothetical protein KKC1_22080 [Calderihabitans maritimus]|uniref:Uncharacterized protein n=1 Tax=Calderihabitans maritimus TaxID=1246530 RepID=A0A1Z5HUP0_9FIRM|nr:hypothetical protein KKC1_22080 [Calderihabitans maritimus]